MPLKRQRNVTLILVEAPGVRRAGTHGFANSSSECAGDNHTQGSRFVEQAARCVETLGHQVRGIEAWHNSRSNGAAALGGWDLIATNTSCRRLSTALSTELHAE
ncbi:MAG: hypothetical protein AAF384_13310 [Pseudomonadota bacterium]